MSAPAGWNLENDTDHGHQVWTKTENLEGNKALWYRATIDGTKGNWGAWISYRKFNYETEEVEKRDDIWEDGDSNRRELKKELMEEMRKI